MAIADALRAEARELYPSATLTLEGGGTLALGAGDFVSLEIQEGADSALTPGCVLSAGFTAELDNAGGRRMPLQGEINLLEGATMACSLHVKDGANWRTAPLGVFIVTGVSADEQRPVIRLSGCDSIGTELSAAFADSLQYPATLAALWQHAVGQTRYAWSGAVPNGSAVIDARPNWGEISLRQALGYIAAAAGCFVQADREGSLRLRACRRTAAEAQIGPAQYMTLTRGFDRFGPVSGIRVLPAPDAAGEQTPLEVRDAQVEGSGTLLVENNPLFMQGAAHLEALARGMLSQLAGLTLVKAEFRWRGDPVVGAGTRVQLTDTRGEAHDLIVTRQTLRFAGGFSATCACETPARDDSGVLRAITPEGGVNAGALVGVVDGGIIAARSITAEKLAAGAVYAQALEAVQAHIQELAAGRITTDELYASLAQIAAAEIGEAAIDHANVKALAAAVAQIAAAQIEEADIETARITDAQVETLAAALAIITRADIETAEVDQALIDWAGINNLTAQAAAIAKAGVGSATISSANIGWAAIQSVSAQLAELAQARIDQATITQAQIDRLHSEVVETIALTAQNANFDFASAQRLVASAMILEQGVGGSVTIGNLTATSAMFVQATMGSLTLKGDDGDYYDVTVTADGSLHTERVEPTAAEIAAGQMANGRKIVETEADIAELNAGNIRAQSAVVSEIFTAALTAEKISASEAFVASATIPELRVAALKAVGDTLDISANQSVSIAVGAAVNEVVGDIVSDIETLNSDVESAQAAAEEAMDAVQNLVVGCVNLVDNSEQITITGTDDPTTSYLELAGELLPGTAYTLSMASALLTAGSAAGMTLEGVRLPDADLGETEEVVFFTRTLDFSGGKQQTTFITADDGHTYALRLYAGIKGASNGVTVELEKVKLEEGTLSTMWTESRADAEARLASLVSQLNVTRTGLEDIVTHVTRDVDGTIRDVNSYFRFDGSDPQNPKLILGSSDSPMTMELTNNRLSFLWRGDTVAYFSDNKLYVTNVEAIQRMSIGVSSNGYLDIVTTATGVGFLWRA